MFAGLGRVTDRWRVWVLVATALFAAFATVWGTGVFGAVGDGGFEPPNAESSRAGEVLEQELGHDATDVVAVYRSDEIKIDNPSFAAQIGNLREELPDDRVKSMRTYLDEGLGDRERGILVSEDRHATYVPITLAGDSDAERAHNFEAVKEELDAGPLETRLGG